MANTRSAQKNVRKNKRQQEKNMQRRTAVKTTIKKIRLLLDEKNMQAVEPLLKEVAAQLARAQSKKVIHKKAASRKMSRLAKKYATLKKEAA
jgi:small subunit ribosomal protein S20